MAAVITLPRDLVELVVVQPLGAAVEIGRVERDLVLVRDDVAAGVRWASAPAVIGAVVVREHLAVGGQQHVVGVAVAGRVDLDRAAGGDLGHVEAVAPAERAADVRSVRVLVAGGAVVGPVGIVEGRQIVDVRIEPVRILDRHGVERREIDLQDRCRIGEFRQAGEVVGGRAGIGVAAHRDVERLAVGRDRHAVGGVVLLRAGQAAHEIDLLPRLAGGIEGKTGDDRGVGIEIRVLAAVAGADARVARRDVEDGVGGRSGGEDAGDLPLLQARVQRAVVVVVGQVQDEIDRFRLGDDVAVAVLGDREGLDAAEALGDVEAPVRSPLQGGGQSGVTGKCRLRKRHVGHGLQPPHRTRSRPYPRPIRASCAQRYSAALFRTSAASAEGEIHSANGPFRSGHAGTRRRGRARPSRARKQISGAGGQDVLRERV